MNGRDSGPEYIHGFSGAEFPRLIAQAAALAPAVFQGLNLGGCESLLEIGCGVGAQTKHILEHWPQLRISSIDKSDSHLGVASKYLEAEIAGDQVHLLRCDAAKLPFSENLFDVVMTIWVLEHVAHPASILSEAKRVLRPGGQLILTEVDNETFGFFPENEVIEGWWAKFNTYQQAAGADPFVGQRLDVLARACGFSSVSKEVLPIVSSAREPERRLFLLRYLRDLLLSGTENLKAGGYVSLADEQRLRREFRKLETGSGADFNYYAVRLRATIPA